MPVSFPDTEWRSYDVDAETLEAAADAVSGDDEAATAEWFPTYEYDADAVLTRVTVTVPTRVTLPRWTGYGAASSAARAEWDRFCAALRAHELGHIRLVEQHLASIDARMAGRTPEAAARAWDQALETLAAASRAYDDRTDHGRKTGTVIDASVASGPSN